MNHFFIITNRDKDMDLSTTNEIKHFLQKKGKTCRMRPEEVHGTLSEAEASRTLEREIPAETECVIVLGGDGTLLRAARNLVNKNLVKTKSILYQQVCLVLPSSSRKDG